MGTLLPHQDPTEAPYSPSSRKLSTHCRTERSWSQERTSRCEGQGPASRVRRAVWTLARLPAGRDMAPSPNQQGLCKRCPSIQDGRPCLVVPWLLGLGYGGKAGGRMGRMKQVGEEGRDGMGDAHSQGAPDHARRWPWAT